MIFLKLNKIINNHHLNHRFILTFSIISALLIIILIKISFVQLVDNQHLIKESNLRSLKTEIKQNFRGTIRDRTGTLLAFSVPVNNIYIDPKLVFLKKKYI